MKKLTTKQRLVLEAARNQKCFATRATWRSKRLYNFVIDFEAGNFNNQVDALVLRGLIEVGKHVDGQWGPRFVNITAAGQLALKA